MQQFWRRKSNATIEGITNGGLQRKISEIPLKIVGVWTLKPFGHMQGTINACWEKILTQGIVLTSAAQTNGS